LMVKLLNDRVDGEEVSEDNANNVGILVGGSTNHNGRSAGLAAPNGPSIQEVLLESCKNAGIQPFDIDSCEIHGSAQLLADAVEVQSTNKALRSGNTSEALLVTSGKTQVGNGIEVGGMFQLLKALYATSYGISPSNLHLNELNPHMDTEDAALQFPSEVLEYRLKSCFQCVTARGFGGMNVSLTSYGSVDEERRPPPKAVPEENRPKLSYWPSGGGFLVDHPRLGYFISGSWNEWVASEKMEEEGDGTYGFTVTLGENRWEQFVIMLDGDEKRILHPNRYKAPKGTMLFGPNDVGVRGSTWLIDGRSQHSAFASLTDENAARDGVLTQYEIEEHASADQGPVGAQYRVRLHISGKWRTVSWARCGFAELIKPTPGRYYMFGSWSAWSLAGAIELEATSPGVFSAAMILRESHTQFLILRNKEMGQVIYPLAENAGMDAQVEGPDDLLYETQWLLHGRIGDLMRVELRIGDGRPSVRWRKA
jgi:hypothetical protein